MIKISIASIPSSNNRYQGQGSKSRAIKEYQHEKGVWRDFIWVMRSRLKARGELDGHQLPLNQATILLFYHFKTKARRDPDNYSGKMILDGLKDNGFIADDSFREIDILPLADFGQVDENSVDIYILEGRQLGQFALDLIEKGGLMNGSKK